MISKKSKKKINGGYIIKNMFGGMDSTTIGKLTLTNTILLSLMLLYGPIWWFFNKSEEWKNIRRLLNF